MEIDGHTTVVDPHADTRISRCTHVDNPDSVSLTVEAHEEEWDASKRRC